MKKTEKFLLGGTLLSATSLLIRFVGMSFNVYVTNKIGSAATIETSMITDGCRVDGQVKNSILFSGVQVEAGAVIEEAVIMGGTVIKSGAVVKHCIIAENVTIGENSVIGSMPAGDENGVATVGAGVVIGENAKIGPNAMVRNNVKDGDEQW